MPLNDQSWPPKTTSALAGRASAVNMLAASRSFRIGDFLFQVNFRDSSQLLVLLAHLLFLSRAFVLWFPSTAGKDAHFGQVKRALFFGQNVGAAVTFRDYRPID